MTDRLLSLFASVVSRITLTVLVGMLGSACFRSVEAAGAIVVTPTAVSLPQLACGERKVGMFYGIDGHVAQGGPYNKSGDAQQIAQLKALGMTVYAQDVWDQTSANRVAQLARVAAPACVAVLTVLVPDLKHAVDESAAYREGRELGTNAARAMQGLGHYYQAGNECDNDTILSGHGTQPDDYDNLKFTKARGSILGMIDGVKAVDSSAKILMCSASWMHYGFTDMLSAGIQPDGSRGHPVPHWDITAWHWYSDMKDITDAHGVNVLQHLKEAYRKPIWITEYGVRPGQPEYEAGGYLIGKNALAGFVAVAKTYDIQNLDMYSLYDDQINGGDGNYGVFENDATTKKGRYETIKRFIDTHPMP
ncbi:glycoside hydrolase family protein [Paraburkholderia bryophila]|uniref:glycosyl hydrolase n=1 Tax=Paraburkholderia bryophila TaxID=420952 RepID=UPI0023494863|nr:glycosyl hydrolase [Paraburkholderia bryophila]WCM22605.1 glycoside hydrolase family protein [Paraburkholderia bryophila]